MNSASVGGKTLEPAVSLFSSIGSMVGIHAGNRSFITPSSSYSSTGPSASGLETFITRVQGMQRQGDYHGRVYDGWVGNPDLERPADESDATISIGSDILPLPRHSATLPAPIDSDQDLTHRLSSGYSSFATGLSVTSSQGYRSLGSMVDHPAQAFDSYGVRSPAGAGGCTSSGYIHPTHSPLPLRPNRSTRKNLGVEANAGMLVCDINATDVPLPGSPPVN
ncbi:hypothetical protein B0J17DRAFT_773177 [Rhizoctonia solani]|nr:hypothetical protein B0J17DRAFT_773177 [Rhizoctonia solani]